MSAVLKPEKMSVEDYLAWEELQEERHEYVDGEIYAMVGVTLDHNRITLNAYTALRQALQASPCGILAIDIKARPAGKRRFFYPDLAVTCDPRDLQGGPTQWIAHPWLIAEVLSQSTAAYNRGKKFEYYRDIETLTHYLLLDTERAHVDLFVRGERGLWTLHPLGADASLVVESPHAVSIPIAAFYEGVKLAPPPDDE